MITVLGEALFDLVPVADPNNCDDHTLTLLQAGGAPLNVAVTLAKFGHDVRFCGALSEDPLGNRLRRILDQSGIETLPNTPVAAHTRLAVVTPDDDRNAFTFYGDEPADTWLDPSVIEPALDQCTGLYVSSMMMVNPRSRAVQSTMLDLAHRREIPIFFDPNPRPSLWSVSADLISTIDAILQLATLVKLSRTDLEILEIDGDLDQQFTTLSHKTNATVTITDGARGCWAKLDGNLTHVQIPAIETLDPTGAGDVFMGALVSSYLSDGGLCAASLRFAAAAGALSAERRGAATSAPSRDEIEEILTQL